MALRAGAEDKKKVYLAAGLCAVMLILLVRFLWQTFGSSAPAPPPAQAPISGAASTSPESAPLPFAEPDMHQAAKVRSLASLDPTLHPEIMEQAESLEYTGHGRNIFSQFSTPVDIPKPVASARQTHVNTGPPPPPPPPPIDLRFYGYASEKGSGTQVFLLHGDDIFIARQGDVVDHRYRVAKIAPTSVQVEDIPYHDTQTLLLQQ